MTIKFEVGADGVAVYKTTAGDMIDAIAYAYFGSIFDSTEAVIEANPTLAGMSMPLPEGVVVRFPPIDNSPKPVQQISLWD